MLPFIVIYRGDKKWISENNKRLFDLTFVVPILKFLRIIAEGITCKLWFQPCKREITFGIPSDYVTRSEKVKTYFNGGSLNLQFKFKDESRSCLSWARDPHTSIILPLWNSLWNVQMWFGDISERWMSCARLFS